VPRISIYGKYALKNAMMPVITVIGINIAQMLAGSAVVETVFGWPGLGSMLVTAINNRDYSLLQACILVSCVIFVLANLLLDIMYSLADPRAKLE
jgi:peptide/nickel transport system permease protein